MKRVMISFLILAGMMAVQMKDIRILSVPGCCALDVCVVLMAPLSFFMITFVPVIILNQYITEKDSRYQFVIRSRSWALILKQQLIRSVIASVMISVVFMAVVVIYSSVHGIPFYNWDSYASIFFLQTDRRLEPGAGYVCVYALVCLVLRCTIMQNILLLFLWGCHYKILGVFVCLCIMFDEAVRYDKVISRLVPFDYDIWCSPADRLRMVLQLAVYVCVFVLAYKFILNRKELLRCE